MHRSEHDVRIPGKWRRLPVEEREELPLVYQIYVSAQRRARPGIVADSQAQMRHRRSGHPDLASRLHPVDRRDIVIVEHPPPRAVYRDHQLGHQLIERRTATTLDNVDARVFAATLDAEGVVRTFRPRRGFAAPPLEDARELPERVQFT